MTSQAPLRLRDESVYRLGPLAFPARADSATARAYGAVALFEARAHEADRRFALDADNVEAVVEVCRGLDGVPLAIEPAAARVEFLGLQGVRRRLDDRLRIFTSRERPEKPFSSCIAPMDRRACPRASASAGPN